MRILSKTLPLFFLLAASRAAPVLAASNDADALQSLVAAERDFAQMAIEKGTREAFLANLATGAIVFEPGPVDGRQAWTKRTPSDSQLLWQPTSADVGRADDLGYTTGPWESRKHAGDAKAAAYGQFVSIWKRQPNQSWKVLLDCGIETPAPNGKPSAVTFPPNESSFAPPMDLKTARQALATTEHEFEAASQKGAGAALLANARYDIRVFRSHRFPALGRDEARLMISFDHGQTTMKREGGGISRSGDLGYSYGTYATERLDGTEHGAYLNIWKLTVGEDWRLIIDLQSTFPATKKKD